MEKKTIIIILGLLPVFFLPTTQNFYDTNKWMLLAVALLFILVVWAIHLLRVKNPVRVAIPWGAVGFGALTVASVVSLFAVSPNKIEAILSPLGPITFFAFTMLLISGSFMTKQEKMYLRWVLYAVTGLLGLIALYQALGIGKLMFPQVSFLTDPLWTPTGSVTTTIALFFITLSLLMPDTIASLHKRGDQGALALHIIACISITVGAIITIIQFIPKMTTGMLPFDVGMVIASQVLKHPVTAAAGVGAENFVTAFTLSRPAGLTANFGANADFFLHMLTVYGIVGLAAALVLVGSLLRGNKQGWLGITKLLCISSLLLIPPTIPLLAVIVITLLQEEERLPKPFTPTPGVRVSAGVLLMLTASASLYFLARAYAAEVFFFRSLRAADTNDGTRTYNLQIRAIAVNTFVSRYHVTYSQTSVSLANSIAGSANKNDQDNQLVGQLLQQAVKEAKLAVSLNPQNVTAWENLGLTYQTIIPVATEAAGWALITYQQAVRLDPNNPTLFVNIGSVFVAQREYDAAIAAFGRAIQLSPSYANAYYNLANAYKLKGDTVNQAKVLTDTLKLVAPESVDYYKIKNELDAL